MEGAVTALPQSWAAELALRGVAGLAVVKSLALLSVSLQELLARMRLALAAGAAVTVPSTNIFVAVP